jgi:hypothetical protein
MREVGAKIAAGMVFAHIPPFDDVVGSVAALEARLLKARS